MCVSLRRGGGIGCEAIQVRARSDGLSCPPDHPRSPPYRDFDVSCKTSWLRARKRLGSVGQSEGLSIPRSSVRFRLKPDNSNSHEFELHRPSNKGTKLLLKVIKAIIINTLTRGLSMVAPLMGSQMSSPVLVLLQLPL